MRSTRNCHFIEKPLNFNTWPSIHVRGRLAYVCPLDMSVSETNPPSVLTRARDEHDAIARDRCRVLAEQNKNKMSLTTFSTRLFTHHILCHRNTTLFKIQRQNNLHTRSLHTLIHN